MYIYQRYYDEHEKLKAEYKASAVEEEEAASPKGESSAGGETGGDGGVTIRSLIASAPITNASLSADATQDPTTPVVAMENPLAEAIHVTTENQTVTSENQTTMTIATEKKITAAVPVESKRVKTALVSVTPVRTPFLCSRVF